jgi:hypothetical protein
MSTYISPALIDPYQRRRIKQLATDEPEPGIVPLGERLYAEGTASPTEPVITRIAPQTGLDAGMALSQPRMGALAAEGASANAAVRRIPYESPQAGDALQLTGEPKGGLARLAPSPLTAREQLSIASGPEAANAVFPLLPADPGIRDHTGEKRGVWSKIGHALEHIGKGALLGGERGGLGGMLAGAVAGGVSPRFADRLEHNLVIKPRIDAERAKMQKESDDTLDRAGKFGQLTDVDAFSGGPTGAARHRLAVEAQTRTNQAAINADRDARLQESTRQHDLAETGRRRRELGASYRAGLLKTPEQRAEYAKSLGLTGDLAEPFVKGLIKLDTDADGNMIGINQQTLQSAQVTDAVTGQPITSFKATQEKEKMARTQALINAGMTKQAAELQVRREIEEYKQGQQNQRQKVDIGAGKYKGKSKKGLNWMFEPGEEPDQEQSQPPVAPQGKTKSYSMESVRELARKKGKTPEEIMRMVQDENPGVTMVFK